MLFLSFYEIQSKVGARGFSAFFPMKQNVFSKDKKILESTRVSWETNIFL